MADHEQYPMTHADEPTVDEVAPPSASVRAALEDELRAAVEPYDPRDWSSFTDGVWARIDGEAPARTALEPEGWAEIAEVLREDHAEALATFEARSSDFSDGFALRWAEDEDATAETIGDLLRAEVDAEVAAKDGAWSAFAQQVLIAIDHAASERTAATAVVALREDVKAELDAMAPKFDRAFREGVERRIFRSARESRSWWAPITDRLRQWLQPSPGLGLAVAAAAAVTVIVIPPSSTPPISDGEAGRVSISAVRFEGDVTVMPADGIAVVWVTDDAS